MRFNNEKNNFVEFEYRNREFYKYIILKIIMIIIDLAIVYSVLLISYLALNIDLWYGTMFLMVWGVSYHMMMMVAFKATVGMMVTKLKVVHKSGFFITGMQNTIRGFIGSTYTLPFVGQVVLIADLIFMFIFKGKTTIDFLSNTILVSNSAFQELEDIENDFIKKNEEEMTIGEFKD